MNNKGLFSYMQSKLDRIEELKRNENLYKEKIQKIELRKNVNFSLTYHEERHKGEHIDGELAEILQKKAIDILKTRMNMKKIERERYEKNFINGLARKLCQ